MILYDPIPIGPGPTCTDIEIGLLQGPLSLYFDEATTALVYTRYYTKAAWFFVGAVVTLGPDAHTLNEKRYVADFGPLLRIYRTGASVQLTIRGQPRPGQHSLGRSSVHELDGVCEHTWGLDPESNIHTNVWVCGSCQQTVRLARVSLIPGADPDALPTLEEAGPCLWRETPKSV